MAVTIEQLREWSAKTKANEAEIARLSASLKKAEADNRALSARCLKAEAGLKAAQAETATYRAAVADQVGRKGREADDAANELEASFSPEMAYRLNESYKKISDPRARADFRRRYARELGLARRLPEVPLFL